MLNKITTQFTAGSPFIENAFRKPDTLIKSESKSVIEDSIEVRTTSPKDTNTPIKNINNKEIPTLITPSRKKEIKNSLEQLKFKLFEPIGRLISDSSGKINHMVFQFPSSAQNNQEVLEAYKILIKEMENDTKFTFLAEDELSAHSLKEFIDNQVKPLNPERIQIIPTNEFISIWTRDSMLPTLDQDEKFKIVFPKRISNYYYTENEHAAIKQISQRYPDIKCEESSLWIDGGNILRDRENNIYLGADSIKHTAIDLINESSKDSVLKNYIINYYEQKTGRKVDNFEKAVLDEIVPDMIRNQFKLNKLPGKLYIIGGDNPETPRKEQQPEFHIDMAVTPINNKTILIGDPKMALDILETCKKERADDNKELYDRVKVESNTQAIERLIQINSSFMGENNFDAAAKDLDSQGFKVIRLPYLKGEKFLLPYVSYNNCLMEEYTDSKGEKVKKVYLPQYGIKALDEQAEKIYTSLGYKVIPINLTLQATLAGALRCITQVIEKK